MNWLKVIVGVIFEIGWVVGLTQSDHFIEYIITSICIILSFYFLINASQQLPVGTAYAVFVGLGASGVTLVDFLIFNEPFNIWKAVLITLLIVSVIGLKLVSKEGEV